MNNKEVYFYLTVGESIIKCGRGWTGLFTDVNSFVNRIYSVFQFDDFSIHQKTGSGKFKDIGSVRNRWQIRNHDLIIPYPRNLSLEGINDLTRVVKKEQIEFLDTVGRERHGKPSPCRIWVNSGVVWNCPVTCAQMLKCMNEIRNPVPKQ
jgi:hypothetical protein